MKEAVEADSFAMLPSVWEWRAEDQLGGVLLGQCLTSGAPWGSAADPGPTGGAREHPVRLVCR